MDEAQYRAMIARYASPEERAMMEAKLAAASTAQNSQQREALMSDLAAGLAAAQRRTMNPQDRALAAQRTASNMGAVIGAGPLSDGKADAAKIVADTIQLYASPEEKMALSAITDPARLAAAKEELAGNLAKQRRSPDYKPAPAPVNPAGQMAANMGSVTGAGPLPMSGNDIAGGTAKNLAAEGMNGKLAKKIASRKQAKPAVTNPASDAEFDAKMAQLSPPKQSDYSKKRLVDLTEEEAADLRRTATANVKTKSTPDVLKAFKKTAVKSLAK